MNSIRNHEITTNIMRSAQVTSDAKARKFESFPPTCLPIVPFKNPSNEGVEELPVQSFSAAA